jgi:acetoin utilization deacetylase AcuC-like enzyme
LAFVGSPSYEMNIGPHVFPTRKFRLMMEECVARGLVRPVDIYLAPPPDQELLGLVLTPAYLDDLRSLRRTPATMRSELPITHEIIHGCSVCASGTALCAELAMRSGVGAVHFGGGFHHGFADSAEGFCYINDVAIGAAAAIARGWCRRVAIVDTDVHQGNGTARIFQGREDVFTFSIHQENLYPIKQRSDCDVGLANGVEGDEYLEAMREPLDRIFGEFRPDLLIAVAGVDPYFHDQLGDLRLTIDDMRRRDEMVLRRAAEAGVPFVTVTAGGYARDLADTVTMHANTAEVAVESARRSPAFRADA